MTTHERVIDIDALPRAAPKLLTPRDVADRLRISVRKVQELLIDRKIIGMRIGKLWRIDADEVDRFLARVKAGEA